MEPVSVTASSMTIVFAARLGQVREAAFAPAGAIADELRTPSAPDLAMLVVAGCQLRQALG